MRSPFWLGRCPGNRITGGKAHHHGTRHVRNRAATAFGMAVTSLWRSKTSLGAKFRRLRAHFGSAHTLARLVYRMWKYGQDYVDKGMEFCRQRYQKQQINGMHEKAKDFGLVITLTADPAAK